MGVHVINEGSVKEFADNLVNIWPDIAMYQRQYNFQSNYDKAFLDVSIEENKKEITLSSFLHGPKLAARPLKGLEPISSDKIS